MSRASEAETPARSSLLDTGFVRELEALRRRLEVRARSGAAGESVARRHGSSAEFQEHRGYEPGDDLRRVDWLAFARKGTPVVKLFRAEEDFIVRLLIDASASLEFGDPTKFAVAQRLAAALGYMALAGSQRAQVLVAQSSSGGTASRALARVGAPRRGRAGLAGLLRDLESKQPSGAADLPDAIEEVLGRSKKPGQLVVLSDFFDGGAVTTALSHACAKGHDVALIQVVTQSEVEPDYEGDYALVDAETGAAVDVTMDARAIEAYVLRFAGLVEELRSFARKHGASYIRALNTEPIEPVVRRFVARSID